MLTEEWILCPICKNKTRLKIREDTVLKNFPLFCPTCKKETLIDVERLNMVIINDIEAEIKSSKPKKSYVLTIRI